MVNRDGRVLLWSEGAEKLTGYLRQEIVGRSCQEDLLKHCDGDHRPFEGPALPLLATLRDGRAASGELSLRTKNGSFLPVHLQTVPLRDDEGTLIGAAEVFHPISAARDERRQSKLGVFGCLDPLTGVLNHSMIQARLKECLSPLPRLSRSFFGAVFHHR